MGTMTQGICKLRNGKKAKEYGDVYKRQSLQFAVWTSKVKPFWGFGSKNPTNPHEY